LSTSFATSNVTSCARLTLIGSFAEDPTLTPVAIFSALWIFELKKLSLPGLTCRWQKDASC
jgi:hypothetical protein